MRLADSTVPPGRLQEDFEHGSDTTLVPEADAAHLVLAPVLDALGHLHASGIVHRVGGSAFRCMHRFYYGRNRPRVFGLPCCRARGGRTGLLALFSLPSIPTSLQDVKAGNLVFTRAGCLKLLDFGLSLDMHDGEEPPRGQVGLQFWERCLRRGRHPTGSQYTLASCQPQPRFLPLLA